MIVLSSLDRKTSQAVKAVQTAAKIGKAVKFVLKPAVNN
jgi:cell division inhibitor SulA